LSEIKNLISQAESLGYDIQKGSIWSKTQIEIIIDGKFKCYIEVFGAGQDPRGGTYDFARPSLQIYDDIESNTGLYGIKNKANRQKLASWFFADCIPALDPTEGKVIMIGTILHEDSLLNNNLKDKRFKTLIISILENAKSVWPDRFPLTNKEARAKEIKYFEQTGKDISIESIEEIKKSYQDKGQLTLFYQEYLCLAQAEEARLFKLNYFRYFERVIYEDKSKNLNFKNAKENKQILITKAKTIILEDKQKLELVNMIRFSTMDLASTGKDKSVIITCAYDNLGNMYVLDITAGHFTPFDKSLEAIRVYENFKPLRFGIEKAGMQNDFFYTIDEAQKATNIKIPVEPLSHGGINKNIRIANLQPLFLSGKIFFNKSDPNTSLLEAQLLSFNIDIEGTHDDIIDTLAYQHHFIKGRVYEDDEENYEDDENTW